MLVVVLVVLAVLGAAYVAWWASFNATRLDRLHKKVDAAEATLDHELVAKGRALAQLTALLPGPFPTADALSRPRPALGTPERQLTENDVHHLAVDALNRVTAADDRSGLATPALVTAADALRESCERVHLARLFYDDSVRDTRSLRARPLTRLLHLAGHRALPPYFDIDDAVPDLHVVLAGAIDPAGVRAVETR